MRSRYKKTREPHRLRAVQAAERQFEPRSWFNEPWAPPADWLEGDDGVFEIGDINLYLSDPETFIAIADLYPLQKNKIEDLLKSKPEEAVSIIDEMSRTLEGILPTLDDVGGDFILERLDVLVLLSFNDTARKLLHDTPIFRKFCAAVLDSFFDDPDEKGISYSRSACAIARLFPEERAILLPQERTAQQLVSNLKKSSRETRSCVIPCANALLVSPELRSSLVTHEVRQSAIEEARLAVGDQDSRRVRDARIVLAHNAYINKVGNLVIQDFPPSEIGGQNDLPPRSTI
ncbi:MAG: hypothetical protein COW24_06160 [Candidatus Kerfeldbacteria bacterium CG15_BIG_FIL_POST_REV_8_21_14_020_45_12]|uniref:Uncharacterized protein n=1 Tax=Candidatus Kerfeldbacteria bacterium CG15_BIG_FIL_POST_REV_8_21_14_020_45_12 TaxID=2014247 RepID=A0A2M7H250_9BACT|nr:MAG: hypothetical protein COW24_06160 [Candidatus Kerfeldbacteria bacterium CG15_BIG_FIL_POST_REV_8_21_14_020_45_12]PJA92873.1 MAG: hypothetical protein CO132_05750 [Candidatus Kerfeldbacteria bacterium CG_4_9_14_3_um_filter_45_8]